jgi:hypothetical protein
MAARTLEQQERSASRPGYEERVMSERSVDKAPDAPNIERSINRLAVERGALFDKAAATFGLTAVEQQRLSNIERELDECFLARRQLRAERDSRRFDGGMPFRRNLRREAAS